MNSRRNFIGTVATGLATTLLGAGDRIRLGLIGAGARGTELARQALAFPQVELVGVADVYQRRLEEARQFAPHAALYFDARQLLEDRGIDAVLIASPQHLHCEHFVDAMSAGKHVYIEKALALTAPQARRMRAAYQASRLTVQVGHQACSSGHVLDASRFLVAGQVGQITALDMRMYRNTPAGKPQWTRPVYPDMNAETIAWHLFEGDSAHRDFDANRYLNWRLYSDYSGGNVHENMSHQLAFWYRVLNLQIPKSATMTGGVYLWRDGREVPDTMNVALEQGEQILVRWGSGFGNNQLGIGEELLGTNGTISRAQQIRYTPQRVNRPDGAELLGRTAAAPSSHMENFLQCLRTGKETNCPFEVGYRVSVACHMAVESLRQGRTVRWDPEKEEIV